MACRSPQTIFQAASFNTHMACFAPPCKDSPTGAECSCVRARTLTHTHTHRCLCKWRCSFTTACEHWAQGCTSFPRLHTQQLTKPHTHAHLWRLQQAKHFLLSVAESSSARTWPVGSLAWYAAFLGSPKNTTRSTVTPGSCIVPAGVLGAGGAG